MFVEEDSSQQSLALKHALLVHQVAIQLRTERPHARFANQEGIRQRRARYIAMYAAVAVFPHPKAPRHARHVSLVSTLYFLDLMNANGAKLESIRMRVSRGVARLAPWAFKMADLFPRRSVCRVLQDERARFKASVLSVPSADTTAAFLMT